jgi:hypothetical protein
VPGNAAEFLCAAATGSAARIQTQQEKRAADCNPRYRGAGSHDARSRHSCCAHGSSRDARARNACPCDAGVLDPATGADVTAGITADGACSRYAAARLSCRTSRQSRIQAGALRGRLLEFKACVNVRQLQFAVLTITLKIDL